MVRYNIHLQWPVTVFALCICYNYISRVHLGFVVIKVAVGKIYVGVLWLLLSVAFHQCTILSHLTTINTV